MASHSAPDIVEVEDFQYRKSPVGASVTESLSPQDIAKDWLLGFSEILRSADSSNVAFAFLRDGWLRDSLVFTWDCRSLRGVDAIAGYLSSVLPQCQIKVMTLDESPGLEPSFVQYSNEAQGVEFAFTFETAAILGRGFARLLPDPVEEVYKALSVFVEVCDIKGHEETGHELGLYDGHTLTWGEVKARRRAAIESNPQVVIIGAAQNGLQVAARFKQMGIRTIVVERNNRVGDNWRQRYPTLTLHTPRTHHSLLYSPFPTNWPTFTPRDKLASWLEQYADSQDLVVWTSSQILPTPVYDEVSGKWSIIVDKNGERLSLHPQHLVLATGTLGDPLIPDISSSSKFKGPIFHASKYEGGHLYTSKRVLVVGAGNTAADVCQDLHTHGAARVTMLQRSVTCVVSAAVIAQEFAGAWPEGVPTDLSDFKAAAMPLGLLKEFTKTMQPEVDAFDREMQEGLTRAGLRLTTGPDGSGQKILVFERLGGYWIDVGLADLIVGGLVDVKSGAEIREFTEKGVIFTDGSEMDFDVVIYATGYHNIRPTMKALFGFETIDHTHEVWGLDAEGELKGCYRPSGHSGLWYAAGDFFTSRYMSKQLVFKALLIKAQELGMTAAPSATLTA